MCTSPPGHAAIGPMRFDVFGLAFIQPVLLLAGDHVDIEGVEVLKIVGEEGIFSVALCQLGQRGGGGVILRGR